MSGEKNKPIPSKDEDFRRSSVDEMENLDPSNTTEKPTPPPPPKTDGDKK